MSSPEVRDVLDIFSIRSLLHDGPLANLFIAEDILTGKKVVLKIPCCDILNHPLLLYHFQNEDRISRMLNHPGLVRFIHRQRSRQYIIMEYIEGEDLRSRMKASHPYPFEKAMDIMDRLCRIVGYLHGRGVFHLDLKPENILCCANARIKLIDFGLASSIHFPDYLSTDLESPLGTPWYIAPEQLLGERSDPCCDIYTLGMIFYELLTGCLPWPRTNRLPVARRRLHFDPAPPRSFNPDIPPQLQQIILRALARQPRDRYTTVKELHTDLSSWQDLAVTALGKRTKPLPFWKRCWPKRFSSGKNTQDSAATTTNTKRIIGAIIDGNSCDAMLAEIKKQALIRSADITLVHIIEEESDSHFRRYGIKVEGEKLMRRIEGAVQLLRRCSLDPGIRLIRGEVVESLQNICLEKSVELLVVGGSRKEETVFSTGSVCSALLKSCPVPVVVAEHQSFTPLLDIDTTRPQQLTTRELLDFDTFLVDLWYEQLHFFTDIMYQRLTDPDHALTQSDKKSPLEQFYKKLWFQPQWQQARELLEPLFEQFACLEKKISTLPGHDVAALQQLYLNDLLPLSCRLKMKVCTLSATLHELQPADVPLVPFLADTSCPVNMPKLSCYGPLLRAFDLGQDLSILIREGQQDKSRQERGVS